MHQDNTLTRASIRPPLGGQIAFDLCLDIIALETALLRQLTPYFQPVLVKPAQSGWIFPRRGIGAM
ncbi:hypothetical protein [Microbulbifer taiwanensis]|uniref:hypothetical protein n=1 Tax=Microbulbifer taiwanensis TaxID=986746 RepID=UPI00366AC15D